MSKNKMYVISLNKTIHSVKYFIQYDFKLCKIFLKLNETFYWSKSSLEIFLYLTNNISERKTKLNMNFISNTNTFLLKRKIRMWNIYVFALAHCWYLFAPAHITRYIIISWNKDNAKPFWVNESNMDTLVAVVWSGKGLSFEYIEHTVRPMSTVPLF